MRNLIVRKIGMTSFFNEDGSVTPATVLEIKKMIFVREKTLEKDGYSAGVFAWGDISNLSKSKEGLFKKHDIKSLKKKIVEFRDKNIDFSSLSSGDEMNEIAFKVGDFINISGYSSGKGFAGVIKRHNYSMGRATHGTSLSHRIHGSTGQCQDPGRVFKNKKMAGRMGNRKVKVKNLKVLFAGSIADNRLLIVKGAVPGTANKNNILKVTSVYDDILY